MLAAAPCPAAAAAKFSPQSWPGEVIERVGEGGRHFVVRAADGVHRVWAPVGLSADDPVISVLPMSDDAPIHAEAALRFWRCIAGVRPNDGRRPADMRTRRARMSLRALDARQAGASYRSMAEALYGEERVDGGDWKTSSLRDTTIRLVRCGVSLMKGDYRRLLRRKPVA